MSRYGGLQPKSTEPLRGPERLEFARVALEEAVGRMVKHPEDRAYYVAVGSRYGELQEIAAALVPKTPEYVVGPGQVRCPNCARGVSRVSEHHSGGRQGFLCKPRQG